MKWFGFGLGVAGIIAAMLEKNFSTAIWAFAYTLLTLRLED